MNAVTLLLGGLSLGAIYGMVALGFVLVFKASGVINFAQGSMVMLGAYFVYDLESGVAHLPFWAALPGAAAAAVVLSVLIGRVVLLRTSRVAPAALLMITLGVDIILRTAAQVRYGVQPLSIPQPFERSIAASGGQLSVERLVALAAGIVAALLLAAFFRSTRWGLSMRVVARDGELARALGIDVSRSLTLAWALAGVLSLVAGVLLAGLPGYGVQPPTADIALLAFPAAILGGLDSLPGAIVGGLVIGLVESITAAYQPQVAPWLGNGFETVSPYLVMVLVMIFRPQGIFGSRRGERA